VEAVIIFIQSMTAMNDSEVSEGERRKNLNPGADDVANKKGFSSTTTTTASTARKRTKHHHRERTQHNSNFSGRKSPVNETKDETRGEGSKVW